jgi:putative peptidoglycan lipid II flippase
MDKLEEKNKNIKNAGIIGGLTLLSRILGFVRDMIFASYFGRTSIFATAFHGALTIPNLFRRLLGEGSLSSSVIPVSTERLSNEDREKAWETGICLINIASLVLALLCVLGILAAPFIIKIAAPGFNEEQAELGANILRILFPYLFFVSLAALSMGLLNSFKHFITPALSPAILNIILIISLVFFVKPKSIEGIRIFSKFWIIGGALQLLIQLPVLFKYGFRPKMLLSFNTPGIKKVFILMLPSIFGLAVYQINILVDRACASFASVVGEGGPPTLYFSNRVMQLPLAIIGIAVATAIFPQIAGFSSQKDLTKFRGTLIGAIKGMSVFMFPATIGLLILNVPIISLLFERGEFIHLDTLVTAEVLFFYSLGLFFYSGIHILSRAFYSLRDTKTPVRMGIIAMFINIVLNVILMFPMKISGLALATAISAAINFILLLILLQKKTGKIADKGIMFYLLKILFSSMIMGVIVYLCNYFWKIYLPAENISNLGARVIVSVLLGIISVFFFLYLFKIEEIYRIKKVVCGEK